jgi:hypothetical protein
MCVADVWFFACGSSDRWRIYVSCVSLDGGSTHLASLNRVGNSCAEVSAGGDSSEKPCESTGFNGFGTEPDAAIKR